MKQTIHRILRASALSVLAVLLFSSCSKVDFKATPLASGINTAQSVTASPTPATPTPSPTPSPTPIAPDLSCLTDIVDYQMDAQIVSFALTGGVNGGAGFSVGGVIPIGLNANYSSGELDTEMNLSQPLYGPNYVHSALGVGKTSNFSVSASVVAGLISGNLGAWQSTGLFQVTQAALTNDLSVLLTNYPLNTGWFSVVSDVLDNGQFEIPLGSTAGLQVGDTFGVYKANYIWGGNGTACANPLQLADPQSASPYAVLKVVQLAPDDSVVVPVDPSTASMIAQYDEIQIAQLTPGSNGKARSDIKHSIRINSVTQPMALTFTNGTTSQTVDMTSMATSQLQTMLNNSSFYLVP